MTEELAKHSTGDVVAGRYTVLRPMGSGAMGALYEVLDTRVSRHVAIKFLSPRFASDEAVRERFSREAHALGRIRHDHVCGVSDHGITDDGVPFIVMELLDGEPLSAVLDREGPLSPERAIRIMLEVLAALGAAHALGIVHRDLKPHNIFMTRGSLGDTRAKLIDFGIAKFLDEDATMTQEGTTIGSPVYMSPEQVNGETKRIDHRADIWAVGVILYECLAGVPPFSGGSLHELFASILLKPPRPLLEVAPSLPPALEPVVLKALRKDIAERYADVTELAAALRAVEAEHYQGTSGHRGSPDAPAPSSGRTDRAAATRPFDPARPCSPSDVAYAETAVDPFEETGIADSCPEGGSGGVAATEERGRTTESPASQANWYRPAVVAVAGLAVLVGIVGVIARQRGEPDASGAPRPGVEAVGERPTEAPPPAEPVAPTDPADGGVEVPDAEQRVIIEHRMGRDPERAPASVSGNGKATARPRHGSSGEVSPDAPVEPGPEPGSVSGEEPSPASEPGPAPGADGGQSGRMREIKRVRLP
jgi:serine/threonine-protein kinase